MLQVPNTDLLAALSRLPDPASPAGQIEEHRRTHLATLRAQRRARLAGLWHKALSLLHPRALRRKAVNQT
jgi:hypothetical protein